MILLVQPPFVQLNTPYPALFYLRSFLAGKGYEATVKDHSIALFETIFCREGLRAVFSRAREQYGNGKKPLPGFMKNPGTATVSRRIIEDFLSQERSWINSVDRLIAFLRGQDREEGHLLALANGTHPGSPRLDAYLASVDGQPAPDSAHLMAGKLLADLADFIKYTIDPSFSLIRYETTAGKSIRDFSPILESMRGCIMHDFYRAFLQEEWKKIDGDYPGERIILGCTIPFPGCLAGALYCAESAKKYFGERVVTLAGGGYVNTELRSLEDGRFFDYFDYLSFDRGYGSLQAILEDLEKREARSGEALYKTIYRFGAAGALIRHGAIDSACTGTGKNDEPYARIDDDAVTSVFPDYSPADFSKYIYSVDDTNPMHRLWTDGRWLKVYLAYGCYWHGCAFCDVQLDYIKSFRKVDVDELFRHLLDQAGKTGIRAVHLVDEAAPLSSLLRLAELNRDAGLPFFFWGNIRFEKNFSPDIAAFLAAGGLAAVSAGIEVASEKGFRRIGKGISFSNVVHACAAFKEAGILTHAYLIYGYWDEDDAEIIDSAEALRQLFEAGLLDSAFWHKFVLTRHSKIYAEKMEGGHRDLRITDPREKFPGTNIFTDNDLGFEKEAYFDQFTGPLDLLNAAWMNGECSVSLSRAFPFRIPKPSLPADFISSHIDDYVRQREAGKNDFDKPGRHVFLGSRPEQARGKNAGILRWRWKMSGYEYAFPDQLNEGQIHAAAELLMKASAGKGMEDLPAKLSGCLGNDEAGKFWNMLRSSGLVRYPG